jgi:hypothetical protein
MWRVLGWIVAMAVLAVAIVTIVDLGRAVAGCK